MEAGTSERMLCYHCPVWQGTTAFHLMHCDQRQGTTLSLSSFKCRGSGVFCCFSTLAPTSCRLDGQAIPFTYTSNTQLLELELPVAAEGGTRLSNKQLDVLY